MLSITNYVRAASLEEAYQLNQKRQNKIIGGMMWLKMETRPVQTAIDLCDLGLDTIEETDEAFSIGCMVTLRQLETHKGLAAYTGGMMERALSPIVGVQFRNTATMGGSLWGRFGFSDVLTLLLAMDCDVELYKGGRVPLADFARMPWDRDILVRIHIRKTRAAFSYLAMRAQKTDLPLLNVCISRAGDRVRVAVGARPARAILLTPPSDRTSDPMLLAQYVSGNAPCGTNSRGSAAYRKRLVKALTYRAWTELEAMR